MSSVTSETESSASKPPLPIGMPEDLIEKGWKLARALGPPVRFRAKNDLMELYTEGYPSIDEAITRARELTDEAEEAAAIAEDAAGQSEQTDTAEASEQATSAEEREEVAEPKQTAEANHDTPDEESRTPAGTLFSEPAETELSDESRQHAAAAAAEPVIQKIRASVIEKNPLTQARVGGLDQATVDKYAEEWLAGTAFPPIDVFYDGKTFRLSRGWHREAGFEKAFGDKLIDSRVHEGDLRDAILYSVGANAAHGLPRSNADKRHAVETLLRDEEWTGMSDSEIARHARVSQPFVSGLRHELESQNVISEQTQRVGGDGVVRDTSHIGRKSEHEKEAAREASPELFEQETEPRKCMVCGCTDEQACEGGCNWISPLLCSGCHQWRKVSLFTEKGGYDKYRCERCGATGKRWGVSWPPSLDKKQPAKCKVKEGEPRVATVFQEDTEEELTRQAERREIRDREGWSPDDVVDAIKKNGGTIYRRELEELGCSYTSIVDALYEDKIVQPEAGKYSLAKPTAETADASDKTETASLAGDRRPAASPATSKPSLEEILKGRRLAVSFTFGLPGLKGKMNVSVNASDDPQNAARKLMDTDKLPRLPEEIILMITEQLKGHSNGSAKTTASKGSTKRAAPASSKKKAAKKSGTKKAAKKSGKKKR